MKWRANETGKQPRGSTGKRAMVKLRGGIAPDKSWPTDKPTRWTLTDSPFDIIQFQVVGDQD